MEKKTQRNAITEGNLLGEMVRFSVPYLIACFLQNFYGLAALFIVGRFNDAASVTAVSVGSQMMHMLTVVIVGLAMGTTVSISYAVGAGKNKEAAKVIGNSILLFSTFAILLTILLMSSIRLILGALQTPPEAMGEAVSYLRICFGGILFITAYNLISSIFRGLGDTRRPMIFVALAGILNIGLDLLFIGAFRMGAFGAALATVISQGVSVLIALLSLRRMHLALRLSKADATYSRPVLGKVLSIGVPIALQDGFIQISFLVITMIANSRGVVIAASVGIVEKIISFLFLVPSAMLSTVSALAAQNAGAGYHERSRQVLRYGIRICLIFGICIFLVCQIVPGPVVSLFVHDEPEVVRYGAQYLMTYALDCIFAGVHFCFSGFFSAYDKSIYSFIHNLLSILLVRIPGALLASRYFPGTLYPMGLAAPMGSLLSCIICLFFYSRLRRQTD